MKITVRQDGNSCSCLIYLIMIVISALLVHYNNLISLKKFNIVMVFFFFFFFHFLFLFSFLSFKILKDCMVLPTLVMKIRLKLGQIRLIIEIQNENLWLACTLVWFTISFMCFLSLLISQSFTILQFVSLNLLAMGYLLNLCMDY